MLPPPEPKPEVVPDGHRPRQRTGYTHSLHLLPWCRASNPAPGHPWPPGKGLVVHHEERRRLPSAILQIRTAGVKVLEVEYHAAGVYAALWIPFSRKLALMQPH